MLSGESKLNSEMHTQNILHPSDSILAGGDKIDLSAEWKKRCNII